MTQCPTYLHNYIILESVVTKVLSYRSIGVNGLLVVVVVGAGVVVETVEPPSSMSLGYASLSQGLA